jgi:hypothetical protein
LMLCEIRNGLKQASVKPARFTLGVRGMAYIYVMKKAVSFCCAIMRNCMTLFKRLKFKV